MYRGFELELESTEDLLSIVTQHNIPDSTMLLSFTMAIQKFYSQNNVQMPWFSLTLGNLTFSHACQNHLTFSNCHHNFPLKTDTSARCLQRIKPQKRGALRYYFTTILLTLSFLTNTSNESGFFVCLAKLILIVSH